MQRWAIFSVQSSSPFFYPAFSISISHFLILRFLLISSITCLLYSLALISFFVLFSISFSHILFIIFFFCQPISNCSSLTHILPLKSLLILSLLAFIHFLSHFLSFLSCIFPSVPLSCHVCLISPYFPSGALPHCPFHLFLLFLSSFITCFLPFYVSLLISFSILFLLSFISVCFLFLSFTYLLFSFSMSIHSFCIPSSILCFSLIYRSQLVLTAPMGVIGRRAMPS